MIPSRFMLPPRFSDPTRIAIWWAILAPELTPAKNTCPRSAYSLSHDSGPFPSTCCAAHLIASHESS
ncbi:hypothetical protein HanRHA438_Chr04g0201581 [Helianthus annuus]|uniref:Uncharacterized protein n=1 Tax=Helianthus annuus TaxID=4232 RepID=A0A9K3JCI8_HELAN|nr:hypothetical protein HanXRQr2_Chr04g0191931 [Helianthus annuus]KAJ0929130.1 hypothetical protein HanRHA438_Chr04g0201581 [Helianthus annuus]KAJ0933492.1 hypothetical protein HanPSC8_Chr04g0185441 [Helianthus annuus]